MPELVEIETLRRQLSSLILGSQITGVYSPSKAKLRSLSSYPTLIRELRQNRVQKIDRTGKYLIFRLSTEKVLISHLGMSGRWLVLGETKPKHSHLVVEFQGFSLVYVDPRRFGQLLVARSENEVANGALGPDFLSRFSVNDLYARLIRHRQFVKKVLMDQSVIAGLGNIYADEVLFQAGISPLAHCDKLPLEKVSQIDSCGKKLLKKAISFGGTTLADGGYVDLYGRNGRFQNHLMVHAREGEPCLVCGETVQKGKISARSYYFCSNCQKENF